MKESTLLYFGSPMEFVEYIHRFEIYKDWKIQHGLMNDRGYLVGGSDFFVEIRRLFDLKDMFRKKVSIAEMTTWLDSFVHLERLCNLMIANFSKEKLDNIEVGIEYVLKMSKKVFVAAFCLFTVKAAPNSRRWASISPKA